MYDIVTAIGAITFIIVIIGAIPYGIWFLITLIRKKWRRAIWLFISPVIAFFIISAITYPLNKIAHSEYLNDLYDTETRLNQTIYRYDSSRSFNGDGYSITVYELPIEIKKRFESVDSRLLEEFPKRPSCRKEWEAHHWTHGPYNSEFEDHLDFSLSSYDSENNPELVKYFQDIRNAIEKNSAFYSFFYKSGYKSYPANIDMFIVDLEHGRLYIINHNT